MAVAAARKAVELDSSLASQAEEFIKALNAKASASAEKQ